MMLTRRRFAKLGLLASASLAIARPSQASSELGFEFLALGDWGQRSEGQRRVARAMKQIASMYPPRFVISTGDNFYPRGVSDENDSLWAELFEKVYDSAELKCPWYSVLGNHDYKGNEDAQITYAHRSTRWVMPSRYYQHTEPVAGPLHVEFFFIDTTPIVSDYPKLWTKWIDRADPDLQLDWLDKSLRNSSAKVKLVIGHHPIFSVGPHGASPELVKRVKPLLEKHGVRAYFNGHDHNLQHHVNSGIHYFVCGSAAQVKAPNPSTSTHFWAAKLGFIRAHVSPSELKVEFIDEGAQVIHATRISIT
jgi:acid phosphatase